MKAAVLPIALLISASACAQTLLANDPPKTYKVGPEKAFLYRSPADTAKQSSNQYLASNSEVTVVGRYSPRWLVVKRTGYLYLAPSAKLTSPDAPFAPVKLLDGTPLPFDEQTHRISYQGVVEVPGATKDQLYVRANEWVAKAYHSANAVIQMQDKEAGRLVVKGLTRVTLHVMGMNADAGVIRHTLTIYVKDGRYKYILSDFTHEDVRPKATSVGPLEGQVLPFGMGKKQWDELRREADEDAKRLIAELQAALNVKGGKDPSDF
ncbi:DUF4468 domain-containing protein [Hymenobacter sp. 5317J-9]|uniref:DUF4468 domain-containing protein n=1 Tax=Hymenobacter sp. 5317J-9 TaxID=2932250 RepID=UPI001FD6451D|nr:DUF4468 domain-containing protein [Hymenobacter sp. 5317J-9]UOQ96649.1 DUF4468 domain-containing protein [Hymenobacter sp. 5317J-9]